MNQLSLDEIEIERLQIQLHAALADITYYRTKFKKIVDNHGHVCSNFEICTHKSCSDSYAAWAIADDILNTEPLSSEVVF